MWGIHLLRVFPGVKGQIVPRSMGSRYPVNVRLGGILLTDPVSEVCVDIHTLFFFFLSSFGCLSNRHSTTIQACVGRLNQAPVKLGCPLWP